MVWFQIDHLMLIGMQKIEEELWKRCASVVFGVLLVLEPRHIPGVLRVFSYLMTFLWLRRSGCVWLLEQRAATWPQVCSFVRQKCWGFSRKERISLEVYFSVIYCHQPHEWLIDSLGRNGKGSGFKFCGGFFSDASRLLLCLSFIVSVVRRC